MKSSLDLCPCDLQRVFGKNRAWQWQCLCPEWRLSCAAAGWSRLMRAMEDASRTQTPWYCVPQSSTSHYHTIFTAFFRKPPLEFSVLLVLLTPNLGFKDFLTKRADKCVARTASRIWFTTASLSFQLDLKDCQNFVIGFLDILQIVSSSELY